MEMDNVRFDFALVVHGSPFSSQTLALEPCLALSLAVPDRLCKWQIEGEDPETWVHTLGYAPINACF